MNSTQYAEDSASDIDMHDLVPTTVNTNSTQSAEDSMGDSKMLDIVSLSTKTTQMDDLPTEILFQITKHLSAKDLGSLRLASRRYGRDGRPFLCANVNVTETRASLERLVTISSQNEEITGSVKHLQYMPFDLDGRFGDTCTPGCGKDCLPRSNMIRRDVAFTGYPGKCGQLWSNYEELVAEREAIAWPTGKENGRLVLTDAFLHIRPTSITIVAPDFHKRMEMRPPPALSWDSTAARESTLRLFYVTDNPEYPRGLPDRNSNNYKPSPHKLYEDLKQRNLLDRSQNVRSDKEHAPVFTRSFQAVLWAVRDSGLKLKSLKASTGLLTHAHPGPISHQKALSNLVDLELDIMLSLNEFRPNQYLWDLAPWLHRGLQNLHDWRASVCKRGILESLLQETPKLENLELAMVGRLHVAFGREVHYLADELELLGTKTWQNLKSIKLRFFNCTDAGLFSFILRHKKTLQHVQIENIEFQCNTGTTMKVFMGGLLQQIRDEIMNGNLKLQSFRLGGCLLGGGMVPVPPAHQSVIPTHLFVPGPIPMHWQDAFRVNIKEEDTQSMNDYVLGLVDVWECGGDVDDVQLVSV